MGIVLVYLPEIRPGLPKHIKTHVARNEILRERSPFPRAGHIIPDELHLLLRVMDVLLHNLIWEMVRRDHAAHERRDDHGTFLQ